MLDAGIAAPPSSIVIQDEIETRNLSPQAQPPIYKVVSPLQTGSYRYTCEPLTLEELQYFQRNGNNATLFIHGYDVIDGAYANNEIDISSQGQITTAGAPWYYNRTLEDILTVLQRQQANPSLIQTIQQGYTDSDINFDQAINGTGAHNWMLHMEYNLNCAAARQYPFPWQQYASNYSRMIAIRWPGDIGNLEMVRTMDFGGAELNALASGIALLPIIRQLTESGITVNLIAHSLGNLVAIKLMDLLGRANESPFACVILWQAAISDRALSPDISLNMETHLSDQPATPLAAGEALVEGVVEAVEALAGAGLGIYAAYLKSQAQQINQPVHASTFAKDPFAYFPYAHKTAQRINVLYSADDEVLQYMYRAQDDAFNLSNPDFIHRAMGLIGPDSATLAALPNQVFAVNQQDWLQGHSAMKIPSTALFQNIYQQWIVNGLQGIRHFGGW